MAGEAKVTTDHEEIKKWTEERSGLPAMVKGTGNGRTGILRIDFPGFGREETLEKISWENFFSKFDEKELAFLYQEETANGEQSRFCKFISRKSIK